MSFRISISHRNGISLGVSREYLKGIVGILCWFLFLFLLLHFVATIIYLFGDFSFHLRLSPTGIAFTNGMGFVLNQRDFITMVQTHLRLLLHGALTN